MEVEIPDLGGAEKVLVVEILVSVGDSVAADQGLITLESDKASMDIPAPEAGAVEKILVKVGDEVVEGQAIMTLAPADSSAPTSAEPEPTPGPVPEPDSTSETEILVLGGGPGGYTAAFRAADLGKKVTLVERHSWLGGVCLNVGCIPSKALLHVAKVMEETAALEKQGVTYGKPRIDLDGVRGFKDSVVDRLTKGLAALAKQRQVEIIRGEGRFVSASSLQVATPEGETRITFQQAIVGGDRTR